MKYRPEIDGLRALALMPVIFFHAGFSLFGGGFVGVDIFFVISGYLISRIILEEREAGTFSLKRFYERRARRILPALYAVMLVTIPIAWAWMLPSQLEDFSISLVAVTFFLSNVFFWLRSGYFAAEAAEKPLLHTWSLGIEEQFYVLVPLALLWFLRFGKSRAGAAVAIAAVVSFALCVYASVYAHSAGFFLLPMRAWELFVGTLCAFAHTGRAITPHNGYSMIGLIALVIAPFVLHEHMHLPSAYTLLPVLGTGLVLLYAGEGTWAARLLSWRPLVGIGLISYSAYLWHHPLFAFSRLQVQTVSGPFFMLALSALGLGLGALTWRYIEQPFRSGRVGGRRALWCMGAALLSILLAAALGYFSQGRLAYWKSHAGPSQVRAYALLQEARSANRYADNGDCRFNVTALTEAVKSRVLGCRKKHGPGVLVIGDSHAINLFHVLNTKAENWPFVVGISQARCRPHQMEATCYYKDLNQLLENYSALFSDIIYKQAGFHLLMDARGNPIERGHIADLPLGARVPDYTPNLEAIDAVADYLEQLTRFARVTWFGSRIEPQIRDVALVRLGCDYAFSLRPNQEEIFRKLDGAIKHRLEHRAVRYRSRIDMEPFDIAHEFISCDTIYFSDGDHYSQDGERYFGQRITLDKLIGKGVRHER